MKKLKLSKTARKILESRYLKKENNKVLETPEQMFERVAKNIALAEKNYNPENYDRAVETFYNLMADLNFLPNSPTLMNAGLPLQQLSACFVLPIDDSMDSIFEVLKHTAIIHKSGGGTGFSFSRLRPTNDAVQKTGGVASGPISFMKVYDAATDVIKQGGKRRGANMGILRVDHPDIMDFITAKTTEGFLSNFNISVAATDEFIKAIKKHSKYDLINPRTGEKTAELDANEVFEKMIYQAWKNGEPGMVFLDIINKFNPTPNIGEIESTNPCGEQPLLPYESCNLGSINLSNMVTDKKINWDLLEQTTKDSVWFLDNVIDMNKFPIPEIEKQTKGNRKIGLGVMGWADMLIKLNIKYNSKEAIKLAEKIMKFINEAGINKSVELAEKRGTFPNWKSSLWDKKGIALRNATITTIAPTGTISIIAGASSGIEPLFALGYLRKISLGEFVEIHPLFEETAKQRGFYSEELMNRIIKEGTLKNIDEIPDDIKNIFITTMDVSTEWHIKTQAAFQKYVDNAVSKTINMPSTSTIEDVKKAYLLAYDLGCKGITVYRDKSRQEQVLNIGNKETSIPETNTPISQTSIVKNVLEPRKRPAYTHGVTIKVKTGCGNMYVTINEDEKGLCEVFAQLGKTGGCPASQTEAIARLVSLSLRSNIDAKSIIRELRGIRCPSPFRMKEGWVLSCPDAIGIALETYLNEFQKNGNSDSLKVKKIDLNISNNSVEQFIKSSKELKKENSKENGFSQITETTPSICPECGSTMVFAEGCAICPICGFSKCS